MYCLQESEINSSSCFSSLIFSARTLTRTHTCALVASNSHLSVNSIRKFTRFFYLFLLVSSPCAWSVWTLPPVLWMIREASASRGMPNLGTWRMVPRDFLHFQPPVGRLGLCVMEGSLMGPVETGTCRRLRRRRRRGPETL